MATNKQLDQQGVEAKKIFDKIADSSKNYNERRKEQTEALRGALSTVWGALAHGQTVNGASTKLEWCRWANPSAKHPERYFYMVMRDKGLKSVQSKKPKVVWLRDGLILSAQGLQRSLHETNYEVVRVQKHGIKLTEVEPKQHIWELTIRVRPVVPNGEYYEPKAGTVKVKAKAAAA